jgi:hypothetical protein
MSATTVVFPFALPPAPMAPDLIRALQTSGAPALSALLSRHVAQEYLADTADHRVLPHEALVARALGLAAQDAPVAAAVMAGFGKRPDAGHWFIVHPINVQVGTHLQMTDRRATRLGEDEARTLFDSVLPLFREDGHELVYGDALTWFMRADAWAELATASPDAASGDNLHPWMPTGDAARAFRRLQNEVQMLWFSHPLNEARQARGLAPINSFWLWGGAQAAQQVQGTLATAEVPDWMAMLAAPDRRAVTPADLRPGELAVVGHALPSGLAEDWSQWLAAMAQLENDWFAPLLTALRAGTLGELTLILTNHESWLETRTSKMAQYRFWRGHSLKALQA